MFIAALFTIAMTWKQLKCLSTDKWIKKMWYTYTMKYYQAIRRKVIPFAATWIDLQSIILSDISQAKKDISYDITQMWNPIFKMIQMDLFIKQTYRYRNQIYGYRRGNGELHKLGF